MKEGLKVLQLPARAANLTGVRTCALCSLVFEAVGLYQTNTGNIQCSLKITSDHNEEVTCV